MRSPIDRIKELGITTRLLFWFLVIAMIPCGVLTTLIWQVSASSLETTIRRSLLVIAENRTATIENLVSERRGNVAVLAEIPSVVAAVKDFSAPPIAEPVDNEAARKKTETLRNTFTRYRDAYRYQNAFLFDTVGKLLFRLDDGLDIGENLLKGPLKESDLSECFTRARSLLQGVYADYQIYPGVDTPLAFVASPVFDPEGIFVGVLVIQVSNEQIFRILGDYNGLGETGEIEVAVLKDKTITYVAPTRSDPQTAFNRTLKLGEPIDLALQNAVVGRRGSGETIDFNRIPVVAVWSYVPSLRWGLVVKQDMSEAYRLVNQLGLIVGGLLLATTIFVVILALSLAKNLTRPIKEAAAVAERVASGDLRASVKFVGRGEAGQLLRSISKMTQDLRSLIGKIQKASISLMSTATQIAATSRQQEQSINEYGTSTNEAAAAVKEISATGRELLKTMTEVNEVAASTASMAVVGRESLNGMDRTMRSLADSTASIGTKLSVISERAATINLVVTTITKVADQTNLLSINAAIEAEKAGEYGLGFLVVAREIRRLADQTAVSTLDIERMVKEMQYSVSAGVMEMDKFSDQVRQGVNEVANLSEQLGSIIVAVRGLTERFDSVTEGVRVQSQGADQIREAVIRISEGANSTLVSIREFNQATGHLRDSIGGLKDEVSRFQVEESRMV